MCAVLEAPPGRDWIAITSHPLPLDAASTWAVTPASGAVVSFVGIVRDHSEGRLGVTSITYEAYEQEATPRLAEVAAEARRRWPVLERTALLHRVGELSLSEPSVAVVVSAPHRAEAFEAARFSIDTLKETLPIWKREHWSTGTAWAESTHPIRSVRAPSPAS
jgi:molybdopterin synthase catalytic subunit